MASARKLIGVTNPLEAEPGTIRGDLAIQKGRSDLINFDSWCIILNTLVCALERTYLKMLTGM